MASKVKSERSKNAIAPVDPLAKFYLDNRIADDADAIKDFDAKLEGVSFNDLKEMAKDAHCQLLLTLRKGALFAWQLGGLLTRLQPELKGDWINWYRSIGLHGNSVTRYKRIFEKIKNPAGLEKLTMRAAERAYKIDSKAKAKKTQPPAPKPSSLPSDKQAREKISEGLAILLQLKTADAKTLKQAKDLALDVLKRIGELEATATNEAEVGSTEVAST